MDVSKSVESREPVIGFKTRTTICYVIRVAHNLDISRLVVVLQPMFCMTGRERESLRDFLVDYDMNLNATVGRSPQESVKAVLLVLGWWSPKI